MPSGFMIKEAGSPSKLYSLYARLQDVKPGRPHFNHDSVCLVRVPLWPETLTDCTTVHMT